MRIAILLLLSVLLVGSDILVSVSPTSTAHRESAKPRDGSLLEAASQDANPEIQAIARRFEKRLLQTRDFGPLIEEFFVARFVKCHVQTMLEKKENGIFSQMGGVSLPPEVGREVSGDELRHYLITVLNFFHVRTLHRISMHAWGSGDEIPADLEYPSDVDALLRNSPGATQSSKSLEQMRAKVSTLDKATLQMRDHFLSHPPEARAAYTKNLERIGNNDYNSKFWEIQWFSLSEQETQGARECFGLRVRRLAVIKVPPFYRLFLVQVGSGFKIGSLLCTEPPCSD